MTAHITASRAKFAQGCGEHAAAPGPAGTIGHWAPDGLRRADPKRSPAASESFRDGIR
jgi:hypothetical protein